MESVEDDEKKKRKSNRSPISGGLKNSHDCNPHGGGNRPTCVTRLLIIAVLERFPRKCNFLL